MSATTGNRGYTYPQSGDDFRPYEDIQALAEAVDSDVEQIDNRLIAKELRPFALLDMGTPSIANNTIQKINASAGLINTGSMWSSGAPSDIVIPTGKNGVYELGAVFRFGSQNPAAGQRNVRLYKNGVEEIQFGQPAVTNYNATNIICAGVYPLALVGGDVITFYAYQNSGGALSLTGNSRGWARQIE
jgi:hypothetical protein